MQHQASALTRAHLLDSIAEDLGSFWDIAISPSADFEADCNVELANLLRSIRLGREPQAWLQPDTIKTAAILEEV